jgi:glucose/arabinose dehydrogenase
MTINTRKERSRRGPERDRGRAYFDDGPRDSRSPHFTDELVCDPDGALFSEPGNNLDAHC